MNIKNVLNSGWYHGDLSAQEAEKRLEERPVGTFLVRLSSTKPGSFTISRNSKTGVSHLRVSSKKGTLSVKIPGKKKQTIKEECSLDKFIDKIKKPLKLKKPCEGSPYVTLSGPHNAYVGVDDSSDE